MSIAEAVKLVDPKWQAEFRKFVDSGDASDGFFEFLDTNKACQKAVDMVLKRKSEGLERVSDLLRSEELTARPRPVMEKKSEQLAQALGIAARLPADERRKVVQDAVA